MVTTIYMHLGLNTCVW